MDTTSEQKIKAKEIGDKFRKLDEINQKYVEGYIKGLQDAKEVNVCQK